MAPPPRRSRYCVLLDEAHLGHRGGPVVWVAHGLPFTKQPVAVVSKECLVALPHRDRRIPLPLVPIRNSDDSMKNRCGGSALLVERVLVKYLGVDVEVRIWEEYLDH